MRRYESYECDKCGNVVEVSNVGGGELNCCGKAMKMITKDLTMVNLLKAFAGESQARNRYEYFANIAQKEKYRDIAEHFQRAADNEKMHAKLELKLYNMMHDGKNFGNTIENLEIAIEGEQYEHSHMYPEFATIAKEENNNKAAQLFTAISRVEVEHEKMFKELQNRLKLEKEFVSDDENEEWICEICGHIHKGKKALDVCPVCKHPKEYQSRLNSKK